MGRGRAGFDDGIKLIRLSRVLPLLGGKVIDLPATGTERSRVLPAHAKQDKLRDIAEIEADTTAVGAAVFADLVPDDIGLVGEAPRLHRGETIREESIRHPQVEMGSFLGDVAHGERQDLLDRHGGVAPQAFMLGGHLPGAVLKPPGRIGENCREFAAPSPADQIVTMGAWVTTQQLPSSCSLPHSAKSNAITSFSILFIFNILCICSWRVRRERRS